MLPGDLFAEKYKILEILGKGGSGCVYLAENVKLGTLWAIKELSLEKAGRTDILIEPNILKKLEHPALPRIYDIMEDEDKIYFILDYIEGVSLDKKLTECGSFPEETVLDWARQLCQVLEYLHSIEPRPVIYRDMKPSNLILTTAGALKLVDFGTAREFKEYAASDTVFIGTRGYAAPEQYGRGQSDSRSDIFSLGVTLHHLLTGVAPNEPPFEMNPVRQYRQDISEEFERIIIKCTRQNPAERYENVLRLREEIEQLASYRDESIKGTYITGKNSGTLKAFKKLVLAVWGNPEFGCELAYMTAKRTGYSVLLADIDLLAPKADLFLNLRKYPGIAVNEGILGDSGLNIVIEAADKGMLTHSLIRQAASRHREVPNLHVLTGNYRLDNYEYFNDESLKCLINKAYGGFDLTVLLTGKWIYDSYTVIALAKSDFNIAAIPADIGNIREFNNYIAFLADKQQIPSDKTLFAAYEYLPGVHMAPEEFDRAVEGNFIGSIRHTGKRMVYRNMKNSYARRMEKEPQEDYIKLLEYFHIVPEPGFRVKLGRWLDGILHTGRNRKGLIEAG